MKVAIGQFAVRRDWRENARICQSLMARAGGEGADLLVLPEAVLARDNTDPEWGIKSAQPLDGPFIHQLLSSGAQPGLTVVLTMHTPAQDGKVHNTLVALRQGAILATYRKLHLYDAFAYQESKCVVPGEDIPPLITVAGIQVGMMTCYDVRFPELARRLVLNGAQALVLPAAWVKGPLKEAHWELLVRARALENTCYVLAAGECGEKNIGASMVVDPMGVVVARCVESPGLALAEVDAARLDEVRRQLPVLVNRRFAAPELAAERHDPSER